MRNATEEETVQLWRKMKSEFAHVHDYLDDKTETSHNIRKRHQASQREDWEELPSRVQLNCAYRHANPIIIAVSHETMFEM